MHRAKYFLNKDCLKSLYYSYIHCYLNYGNLAWGSTYKTDLKKIHSKQKHAIRIVSNASRLTHTRPLMRSLKILNIYQLNIHKTIVFMHQVKTSNAPYVFREKFKYPSHKYPTTFSKNNFLVPKLSLQKSRFKISVRGPRLWNKILLDSQKVLEKSNLFKAKTKEMLVNTENAFARTLLICYKV